VILNLGKKKIKHYFAAMIMSFGELIGFIDEVGSTLVQ
jgi:hypothetical protein